MRSRRFQNLSISCLLILLLSGCTNVMHVYKGSTRSSSEVAIIEPWSIDRDMYDDRLMVWVSSVNGKSTYRHNLKRPFSDAPAIALLPGTHRIKLSLWWTNKKDILKKLSSTELDIHTEADHSYVAKVFVPGNIKDTKVLVSYWVEDKSDKTVVAGTRNQKSRLIKHKIEAVPL